MKGKRLFAALVLGLGAVLVVGWLMSVDLPIAWAASLTVDTTDDELNDGSDCSLREAIQAANTDAAVDGCTAGTGDDTIVLPAGIYTLTLAGVGADLNLTGDLDITGTDALTITGQGPSQTIIDASGLISDRAIHIQAGTVVISGVTVLNGNIDGYGGGIYNQNADLLLVNTVISNNTASSRGGGVYVESGSATLSGGQIVSNTAHNGGGVYVNQSTAAFTQTGASTIIHNHANFGGGGVYVYAGRATLNSGEIVSNTAFYGGGMYVWSGSTALEGGGIISNTVGSLGGGLYVYSGDATLNGGQIVSNTAENGGGMYVNSGSAMVSGAQITNNAAGNGGGLYNAAGTLTLLNVTVNGNRATSGSGGGLYSEGIGASSAITYTTIASNTASGGGGGIHRIAGAIFLQNTIVAYNGAVNCSGALTSNGHNLDDDDACSLTATGDITGTDPLLGPLTEEDGTWIHPLQDGSPAIDAGTCLSGVTTVDQRGVTRPEGLACDIGAYEWEWHKTHLPLVLRNSP